MSNYSGEPHCRVDQRAGNHSGEPHGQRDQRAGQFMHCYQSIWKARVTQTNCSAIPQVQTGLSLSLSLMGNRDIGAKKFTEVTDTRTVRILNEGVTLNERLDCQPFSMFNIYQNIGCIDSKISLDNLSHGGVSMPQFDFKPDKTVRKINPLPGMADHGSGLREHIFQSKRVSQCFEAPATQIIPYGSNKGKAPQLSFVSRHEKVKQLTLGSTSKAYVKSNIIDTKRERNHDLGKNPILGHDKNWDEHSTSREFETSFMRPSMAPLLLHEPSVDHNYGAVLAGGQSKKMQKFSHTKLFANRRNSTKEAKSRNFTANSSHGLVGGSAKFSQMTRNLLSMKNTDINKSKQGIVEPSNSMKSNRNMFSQLLSLSQPLSVGQKGVKIQLLDSSSESQGKHDTKEIMNHGLCQKNESSAETATMDMESFKQQNNHSGVSSSTSNKNILVGHDRLSQDTGISAGKKSESKRGRARIPDLNEFPVIQGSSSSMDNSQPSTSRTQSLDAEHLLFHSEHPINCKRSRFLEGLPTAEPISTSEPSSRWLKRLKLSVPHSCGIGTKSSNTDEALSHRKVGKSFSKGIEGTRTCSSHETFDKDDHKEEMTANQSAIVRLNVESSSVDPAEKDLDIPLTHSWIKRWCATQKKKLEAVVVCEPQSTKMDFDELRNKQFPSIGAMALMGKAMNGFQACEFQKRGSLVLWNTRGLSSG